MSAQDRGHPPFPSIFDKKAMEWWALDPALKGSVLPFTRELMEALEKVDPGANGLPEVAWQVAHEMQKVLLGGQQRQASKANRPGRRAASPYADIRPLAEAEARRIRAVNPTLIVNAIARKVEDKLAATVADMPSTSTLRSWIKSAV